MEVWTSFFIGLVGSLHCVGMCGPLALALPVPGKTVSSIIAARLLNNLGRLLTYACIGLVFGLVGQTLALAGIQRWVSILVGSILLGSLFLTPRLIAFPPIIAWVHRLKSCFGSYVSRRNYPSLFILGVINGFLPCGLVYVAASATLPSGSLPGSVLMMLGFGLGTLPMMLAIPLFGRSFSFVHSRKLIPAAIALAGILLVLRGLQLDIPYLSPLLSHTPSCH